MLFQLQKNNKLKIDRHKNTKKNRRGGLLRKYLYIKLITALAWHR